MASLGKYWPAWLSAILLAAALPPFNMPSLVFVALCPLIFAVREGTPRENWKMGRAFGFVFSLFQLWFFFVLSYDWTGSLLLGIIPWLLGAWINSLYFGLFGWLAGRLWKSNAAYVIPLAWGLIELLRAYIPVFAFPWSMFATALAPWPALIQPAYYLSSFGVSAWVALPAVILAVWFTGEPAKVLVRPILVFCGVLALSIGMYYAPIQGKTFRVAVVQPGVDFAFGDRTDDRIKLAEMLPAFFARAKRSHADVVVLPEGLAAGGEMLPPATSFQIPEGIPIIFGGQRGAGPAYQTAFAYDGKWQYADKTRLVIFGEFVPLRDELPFLAAFKLPSGDLTASDKLRYMKIGRITVGPVLCFEGMFPDIAARQALAGVDLLAVMSIDDWYLRSSAPQQLRNASIVRAIETRKPLVRSATSGYSLVVNAKGVVQATLPLRASEMLIRTVQGRDGTSSFLPPIVCGLMFLGLLAFAIPKPQRGA